MTTIAFDLDIYSKGSIIAAIEAFSGFASVSMHVVDGSLICELANCILDPEQTKHELQNYALQLTIEGV